MSKQLLRDVTPVSEKSYWTERYAVLELLIFECRSGIGIFASRSEQSGRGKHFCVGTLM